MARSRDDDDRDDVVAEISGRSVSVLWGGANFQISQWGSARLIVTPTRLVEKTKFFITSREVTIPLEQITSVQLLTTGNPIMLLLAPLCGLGLLLFMLFKIRLLIVQCPGGIAVIGVKGTQQDAQHFIEDLLDEVDRRKAKSVAASAPAAPSRGAPSAPEMGGERVTSSPKGAGGPKPIRCPECDKEYRIPAGSGGKKFRCQACQAVIEVGSDF